MSKLAKNSALDKDPPPISELCEALRSLAKKKLHGRDSENVLSAVEELRIVEKLDVM
jgi:hypothetical protein